MSSIFDPGRDDRNAASAQAQQGVITGSNFSGPGGLGGSFDFSGGVGSSSSSLGSFQSLFDQMQGMSGQGFQQAMGGLPQGFQQLGQDTIAGLQGINGPGSQGNMANFTGFGDVFANAQQTATADPFELGSTISDKLRQLSERKNSRLVNKTFDRLKASGKLGTSGGANIAGQLEQNLFDQGLQHDLAGLQAGQSLQQQAFSMMQGSNQGMEGILSRQFGEGMAGAQFDQGNLLAQFGVGNQQFENFLRNQAQGTQMGLAGAQGAAGLSQLPLAFQQALMGMTGQASNTNFAQAGVSQNNASMAQSPWLEALSAAGGLASAIAPGGFLGNPVGAD